MDQRIYLDVASAARPLAPASAAAQGVAEQAWADPTRLHEEGRTAADLLSAVRRAVAGALGGDPGRCALTSGGTEAIHLAIRGAVLASRRRPPRIVSSAVEHSAVLAASDAAARAGAGEHVRVGVDDLGRVRLAELEAALDDATVLVNVQHANHEVGALQPVREVAAACRAVGAQLHVDACQTAGRLPVSLDELGADLLSVSSAKVGGGAGAGALLWSPRARFVGLLTGDEREHHRRAGLPDLPRLAAFAEALLQLAPNDPHGRAAAEAARADELRRWLRVRMASVPDVVVHGPERGALPHLVAASALYVEGQALATALDARGFAVHSGSSCATTSGQPSHVLVAMGALTHGHVRVSFGADVGRPELEAFSAAFVEVTDDLRSQVGRSRPSTPLRCPPDRGLRNDD